MTISKTRKPLMGLAAFLIFTFHFFPAPRSESFLSAVLQFIVSTGYIGVDIFFFLSGYMSFFSDTTNALNYEKKKLLKLYPSFFLSALLYFFSGKMEIGAFFSAVTGISLFKKGGASFLWFLPALMIFYLTVPLFHKFKKSFGKVKAYLFMIIVWAALMIMNGFIFNNSNINIFLCRFPIFFIGAVFAEIEAEKGRSKNFLPGFFLLIFGTALSLNFASIRKYKLLIDDSFYLLVIPQVLGLVLTADRFFSVFKSRIFSFMGKISLELYCLQMVCGAEAFQYFYILSRNGYIAFFSALILLAFTANLLSSLGLKTAFQFTSAAALRRK